MYKLEDEALLQKSETTQNGVRPDCRWFKMLWLSLLLQQSRIVLTPDTYSHVLPSMQQGATEKLEQMLFKRTGTQ
jgi:hypothetical protein